VNTVTSVMYCDFRGARPRLIGWRSRRGSAGGGHVLTHQWRVRRQFLYRAALHRVSPSAIWVVCFMARSSKFRPRASPRVSCAPLMWG
jgi:hypothetical protein